MDRSQFTVPEAGEPVFVRIPVRTLDRGEFRDRIVETVAFVPAPLPPKQDWAQIKLQLFEKHSETLLALGRLNGLHKRVRNSSTLLRAIWLREAKLSSEIEDIHTTAAELVLAGANRALPLRSRGRESFNYVEALEHGVQSELPVSGRLIREIHEKLLRDVHDPDRAPIVAGEFRKIQVYIGNSDRGPEHARYVPPPPGRHLDECLRQFEDFANRRPSDIPPLLAIAMEHYQFEAIHPFIDGNGRVGRVLMSRSLVTERLLDHPTVYFSSYIYKNKSRYNDLLLRVSTHAEWFPWIEFVLDAILTQAVDSIARSERLIELRDHYYESLRKLGAKTRVFGLIERLFAMPVVNAEEARPLLGNPTKPTVYSDISLLERAGILSEITGQQRVRDWMAKDILSIIETEDTNSLKRPNTES